MATQRLAVDAEVPVYPLPRSDIAAGSTISVTYRVRVERVMHGRDDQTTITAKDLDSGDNIEMAGNPLFERALSAGYYADTFLVSKTKMAQIFVSAVRTPFTVHFTSQRNEERILVGWRSDSSVNQLGQSLVEDLMLPAPDRVRTVTHDKIKLLIVNGVRYIVE